MWQYIQETGELLHDWLPVGAGYSGHEEGKNNPEMQAVPNVGPIPCGTFRIGRPYHHPELGDCTMNLEPIQGTELFGRSGFRMHGDGKRDPGEASHGCICVSRAIREEVAASPDDLLKVIARPTDA